MGVDAFSNVAGGDIATVTAANLSSFGSEGESWNGFILNAFVDPMVADLEAQLAEAIAERDAAIAERDAAIADREATVEELRTAQVERDSILSDIQLAYDEVNAATGGAAEEDLVAVAPTTIFDLVWTNSGDPTDTIEMTIEFPQATLPNPVYFMFDTVRPPIGTVLTIDYQGTVTVINEPNIIFISVLPLDFSQELMGQNGFDVTVGGLGSGDFNLEAEVPEGTFTGQDYFTLRAPDGSEYILTSMLAPAPSRFSSLELNPLTELYSSLVATNEEAIAERDAAIAERDACPTTEELAAVEAERDARPTQEAYDTVVAEKDAQIAEKDAEIAELKQGGGGQSLEQVLEQVRDARAGSVVLTVDPEGDTVTLGLTIEQSDNLIEWTKLEGEITRTIPIPDGKKFYRFALDKGAQKEIHDPGHLDPPIEPPLEF